jgi:hypothetical protein
MDDAELFMEERQKRERKPTVVSSNFVNWYFKIEDEKIAKEMYNSTLQAGIAPDAKAELYIGLS